MPQHGLHVCRARHTSLPVVGPSRLAVRLRLMLEHVGTESLQYQRAQVSFVVRLALVIAARCTCPECTHGRRCCAGRIVPIPCQGHIAPAALAQQPEVTHITRLTLTTAPLGRMSALSASSNVSWLS